MKSINTSYKELRKFEIKELRLKNALFKKIGEIKHDQTNIFLQHIYGFSIAKVLQKLDNAILYGVLIDLLNYKTLNLDPKFIEELKIVLEYIDPKPKKGKKKNV